MIHIEIISPERIVQELEADEVVIPTAAGVIGVRRGHVPLIVPIKAGEAMIKQGREEQYLAVFGGLVEVLPDRVRILADSAERAEEIDEKIVQQAVEEARRQRAEAKTKQDIDAAIALIEHNLARLKVAQRRKARGRSTQELP
ncbi:ATP synthase F1 subunit epsilon [Patescibacteria group bacterium]|nr:ATP synthase F1 subunit epsilon [Patescibacteria group bacterium]